MAIISISIITAIVSVFTTANIAVAITKPFRVSVAVAAVAFVVPITFYSGISVAVVFTAFVFVLI